jgi:hypothetical protein
MEGENQLTFPLDLTFFGLTSKTSSEFRKSVFDQIHQIVFYGKGGYDWNTVYNMPLWLRKYTFKLIKDHYEAEKKSIENSKKGKNQQTLIDSSGKISPPKFQKKSSYK